MLSVRATSTWTDSFTWAVHVPSAPVARRVDVSTAVHHPVDCPGSVEGMGIAAQVLGAQGGAGVEEGLCAVPSRH